MKLFHKENGEEVVYVQLQDLMYLINDSNIPIPASIITQVFSDIVIVTDENRFDFVKFVEESEISFFKELDFILDFDEYKDLTDKQLEEKADSFICKSNDIALKWNNMSKDEKSKNTKLYDEYYHIKYMLGFLSEIYAVKHRKRTMPFPEFVKFAKHVK